MATEKPLEKYKNFYDELKKNVVMDFCTAGIKAEVIIDTLITPYVCDIVKTGLKIDESVELVAKEFPIYRDSNPTNLKNAKVDYLLKSGNTFYMVELKTTKGSENEKQLKRYSLYLDRENYIFDCFSRIVDKLTHQSIVKNLNTEKEILPVNLRSTEKYITTIVSLLGKSWRDNISKLDINEEMSLYNANENIKVKLVYLTLYQTEQDKDKAICDIIGQSNDEIFIKLNEKADFIEFISICQFINPRENNYEKIFKKNSNWELVAGILEELFKPSFIDNYIVNSNTTVYSF